MATTFTFEEVSQAPTQTFTFEDLQATPTPVAAPKSREFQFSDIFAVPAAVGEVGLQMGTGLGSQIVGGYRGIKSLLSGEGVDEAARKVTEVTEGGTYQPKTELGQGASQAVAYPFQKGMELTKQAGGAVGEFVGGEQGRIAGESLGEQLIPVAGAVAPLVPVARGTLSKPSAAKMSAKIEDMQKAAPKIEVAREGAKIGMVFDVSEVNPNAPLMSRVGAGSRLDMLAAKKNAEAARNQLKQEIGIDPDVPLSKDSVKQVIAESGKAYDDVRGVGDLSPNQSLADSLRNNAPKPIRGLEKQVKEGNRVVAEIADAIESGSMTASQAVDAIKGYRDQAKNWYKIAEKGDAKRNPKAIADAYKAVSDSLESLLEANIKDKAILDNFRSARENIAKAYTVEAIINPKTGIPDLSKLTTSRFANAPLTGVLKTLKDVAETFPEATSAINKYGEFSATIPRTSLGGTAGAMIGSAAGNAAGGSSIGASLQVIGDRLLRNRLLSPEYQRANLLPEYARYINEGRIQSPLTQSMPRAVPPAPTSQGLSLAPIGEPLLPPSAPVAQATSTTMRPSDLLSINYGRDVVGNRAKQRPVEVAGIDFPLSPAARPLYQRGGIAPEPRLPSTPFSLAGLPKELPDVPPVLPQVAEKAGGFPSLPPSIQGNYPVLGTRDLQLGGSKSTPLPTLPPMERGLLGLADESRPSRKLDIETMNFPLRQEKAMEITTDFLREKSIIESAIRSAPEGQKRGLIADLRRITQEFTDVLAKNGMTPEDAMGLMKLYQSREGTRLPVQKTFSGMLRGPK